MTLGRGVLLYFCTLELTVGIYNMFHHKIYIIRISHSSNFNLISILLLYENNIKIFFLSIVMDSDDRGTMSVTITIFSDSVLGITVNDAAGFSSAKYIMFG